MVVYTEGARCHTKKRPVHLGVVHVEAEEEAVILCEVVIQLDAARVLSNTKRLHGCVVADQRIRGSRGSDRILVYKVREDGRSRENLGSRQVTERGSRTGDPDRLP